MTKAERHTVAAVLKFPRETPPVKSLRMIGHEEFTRLFNNGDILLYSYGSDYTASPGMLLIERESGKSGLKKLIEQSHDAPNALGMMQLYLREHFGLAGSAFTESTLPVLDDLKSQWELSNADYLYYMLAARPEQNKLVPVTITLRNGQGTGENLIVKWEPDRFFNVLAEAHGRTMAKANAVTPDNNIVLHELSKR